MDPEEAIEKYHTYLVALTEKRDAVAKSVRNLTAIKPILEVVYENNKAKVDEHGKHITKKNNPKHPITGEEMSDAEITDLTNTICKKIDKDIVEIKKLEAKTE